MYISMCWALIAVLAFMMLDILSGIISAIKNHELSSAKMRDGIFKKSALLLVLGCAWLIETFALHVPDLGFSVPLFIPVCVIFISMEVVSVIENAIKINPELKDSDISKFFNKDK